MPALRNDSAQAPSKVSSTSEPACSPTKKSLTERLKVGTYPWLWNKDHTRYAGETVIPQSLFEITDYDKREAAIDDYEDYMLQKPLTDEEKRQKAEWMELIHPEPMGLLDDDVADDLIAWAEGRGPRPACLD